MGDRAEYLSIPIDATNLQEAEGCKGVFGRDIRNQLEKTVVSKGYGL